MRVCDYGGALSSWLSRSALKDAWITERPSAELVWLCLSWRHPLQRKKNMHISCSGTSCHCMSCVNSVRDAMEAGASVGDQSQVSAFCRAVKKCRLNWCAVQCPVVSLASRIVNWLTTFTTDTIVLVWLVNMLQEFSLLQFQVVACYKPTDHDRN